MPDKLVFLVHNTQYANLVKLAVHYHALLRVLKEKCACLTLHALESDASLRNFEGGNSNVGKMDQT